MPGIIATAGSISRPRFSGFRGRNDRFDQVLQLGSVEVDSADDPFGIDNHIAVARQVEDADGSVEAAGGDDVWPSQLVSLQNGLGLRKVLLRLLEVAGVD